MEFFKNTFLFFLFFIFLSLNIIAKPLTFVTYHATSQYYPNMSASQIAAIVPYGGKLKLKTEPELDYTYAKKKLKAGSLLSEGDVQFGGTEETKGSLELKNVSGTAKSLETVDAYVQNLYLYNIQFPNPNQAMQWKELKVKTAGNNTYTATFLTFPSVSEREFNCRITMDNQTRSPDKEDFVGNNWYDLHDTAVDYNSPIWKKLFSQKIEQAYDNGQRVFYDVFSNEVYDLSFTLAGIKEMISRSYDHYIITDEELNAFLEDSYNILNADPEACGQNSIVYDGYNTGSFPTQDISNYDLSFNTKQKCRKAEADYKSGVIDSQGLVCNVYYYKQGGIPNATPNRSITLWQKKAYCHVIATKPLLYKEITCD